MILLWLIGLWCLVVGKVSITNKIRLSGKSCRWYGAILIVSSTIVGSLVNQLVGFSGFEPDEQVLKLINLMLFLLCLTVPAAFFLDKGSLKELVLEPGPQASIIRRKSYWVTTAGFLLVAVGIVYHTMNQEPTVGEEPSAFLMMTMLAGGFSIIGFIYCVYLGLKSILLKGIQGLIRK